MAGLFRRLWRDKSSKPAEEEEPEPEAAPEAPAEEYWDPGSTEGEVGADAPAGPEGPAPEEAPPGVEPEPAPAVDSPPVPVRVPSGPPPPLPLPAEEAGATTVPTGPGRYARCFLCGSRLDGPWCPTCRMVWND